MSTTAKIIGRIPVSRGMYDYRASYYKDNIVTLNNTAYICKVTGPIRGVDPYHDVMNAQSYWQVFAGLPAIDDFIGTSTNRAASQRAINEAITRTSLNLGDRIQTEKELREEQYSKILLILGGELEAEMPVVYVDRGTFLQGGLYYFEAVNESRNSRVKETSDVWNVGCKWRCKVNLTEQVPKYGTTDWERIEGYSKLSVTFEEKQELFDPHNFVCPLTLNIMVGDEDITSEVENSLLQWFRQSWDAVGNRREELDEQWALRLELQGRNKKSVTLIWEDLDADTEMPSRIIFGVTVMLNTETATITRTIQ